MKTEQEEIITFKSDLEIIISSTRLFTQVSEGTLPSSQAMNAYDTFHKVHEPLLKNYTEVAEVRNILENFDKKLGENYPGRF